MLGVVLGAFCPSLPTLQSMQQHRKTEKKVREKVCCSPPPSPLAGMTSDENYWQYYIALKKGVSI